MADIHGKRATEELVPHLNWTEDSMGHYLSVRLPGFKKEDLMVGLAYPGYVTISGERKVNDDKCIYFGQAVKLPENIDMNKVDQSFDDEILSLTFAKRVEKNAQELIHNENPREHDGYGHAENEEQSKQTDDHIINVHKEMGKKGRVLERAVNLLKNNIVLPFVLAFSLVVFLSQKVWIKWTVNQTI